MKRSLLTLPLLLAFSVAAPAYAADNTDSIINALLSRIEGLTERNTKLTVENERLLAERAAQGDSQARGTLRPGEYLRVPEVSAGQAPPKIGGDMPLLPGAALDAKQLDPLIRQWVQANAGYIYDSVNKHLSEQQQASMPKPADFAARRDELFVKDAVKAGAPDEAAKVRLVMFADYNCRYCKEMQPVVEDLIAKNPDLQVVYRDLPILSPTSRLAAQAARAADGQGKYVEFHKGLYKLPQIDENAILDLAARLNLDVAKLRKDMASADVASLVTNDFNLGQSLRIGGTPFFYIDGGSRTFPGAVPAAELQKVIEQARGKKG